MAAYAAPADSNPTPAITARSTRSTAERRRRWTCRPLAMFENRSRPGKKVARMIPPWSGRVRQYPRRNRHAERHGVAAGPGRSGAEGDDRAGCLDEGRRGVILGQERARNRRGLPRRHRQLDGPADAATSLMQQGDRRSDLRLAVVHEHHRGDRRQPERRRQNEPRRGVRRRTGGGGVIGAVPRCAETRRDGPVLRLSEQRRRTLRRNLRRHRRRAALADVREVADLALVHTVREDIGGEPDAGIVRDEQRQGRTARPADGRQDPPGRLTGGGERRADATAIAHDGRTDGDPATRGGHLGADDRLPKGPYLLR